MVLLHSADGNQKLSAELTRDPARPSPAMLLVLARPNVDVLKPGLMSTASVHLKIRLQVPIDMTRFARLSSQPRGTV